MSRFLFLVNYEYSSESKRTAVQILVLAIDMSEKRQQGLSRSVQPLVDFLAQQAEVDGLGKQSRCPEFSRPPSRRLIPVRGDHDDGNIWPFCLTFGSISSPVIPGMLMSERIK